MDFLSFFKDYGSILVTFMLLLIYIILLVITWIKKKLKKPDAKLSDITAEDIKGLTIGDIYETIPKKIATAESLFSGKGMGEAKLDHVLTHLKLDAFDNGLKLDVDKATEIIESIIDATKKVNIGMSLPIIDVDSKDE